MSECKHKDFYEDNSELDGTYFITYVVCRDCDATGEVAVEIPDYYKGDIEWKE